jgi:hypothetical protein
MKSLKGTVLSTFSYSQTQRLCAEHPTALDCDWDLWREKAVADFNISGEFFDLVSQLPLDRGHGVSPILLPGSQRYLQIKSYHVLTPDMAVRVYSDGFIEGVYEAYAGYLKALETNNKAMMRFFASRLQAKKILELGLSLPVQPLSQEFVDALNSNNNYTSEFYKNLEGMFQKGLRNGDKSLDFLLYILSSGRVDWIDQILHRYFTLPPGFSIEKDIPYVPFWAEEFPLYEQLPPYGGNWFDAQKMLSAAVRGSNVKVVDFFRSVLRETLDRISMVVNESNKQALGIQKKPEAVFGIYKRFAGLPLREPFMIEQVLDLQAGFLQLNKHQPGNIANLLVSLPYLEREELERLLNPNYPLSERIIQEYLNELQ